MANRFRVGIARVLQEGERMKTICQFCGWEITKPEWYNNYNKAYACNDCLMDKDIEHYKEREGAI